MWRSNNAEISNLRKGITCIGFYEVSKYLLLNNRGRAILISFRKLNFTTKRKANNESFGFKRVLYSMQIHTELFIIQRDDFYIQNICQGTPKSFMKNILLVYVQLTQIVLFVLKNLSLNRVQRRSSTSSQKRKNARISEDGPRQTGNGCDHLTLVLHVERQVEEDVLGCVNLGLELGFGGEGQIRVL